MDVDHRPPTTTTTATTTTTTSTSDLFVCFTSRFCSFSSMKLREPNKLSSSASLSRRLRASGSLKGGQSSPMLILTGATTNKKRGYAFENPEPSSPKVTCIGQVRVKSRKSGRPREGNERNRRSQRNQRWVHLPLSICEALNCVMPCLGGRSVCDSERKAGVKRSASGNCGAVFARWLMALQETEVKGGAEVGFDEKQGRAETEESEEIGCGVDGVKIGGEMGEIDERVSVCIPPRNALLLMRCRSDPLRISALANRFVWDPSSPAPDTDDEEDEDEEENEELSEEDDEQRVGDDGGVVGKWVSLGEVGNQGNEETLRSEDAEHSVQAVDEAEQLESSNEADPEQDANLAVEEVKEVEEDEEISINWSLFESFYQIVETTEEEEETEHTEQVLESQQPPKESQISSSEVPSTPPLQEESELNFSQDSTTGDHTVSDLESTHDGSYVPETEHFQQKQEEQQKLSSNGGLPDCLLSMLCEPKLSMEISKETWVCSTDFIRHNNNNNCNNQVNPVNGPDDSAANSQQQVSTTDGPDTLKPNQVPSSDSDHPPRSSMSSTQAHPTAPNAVPSMAAVVMHKLVSAAVAHEPFVVLTRCKSEPLRSSARLVPEACSWKNQNLQPHRRAPLGVGAAPKC